MAVFGVLGGDRRQLYLARSLEEDGHTLFLHGLEGLEGAAAFPTLPLEELGRRCPVVVLPLPAVREGSFLNAPFAQAPIPLDDSFAAALAPCLVLGGMVGKLRQTSPLWETIPLEDYYQREELTVGNAFLTAEGALALAVEHAPGALGGSRCLVAGFGRIGKALCLDLRALGAQVDCAARKPRDLAAIRAMGCGALTYGQVSGPYDVIFNTVPAPVIGEKILACQGPDTLLLELASAPGGICRRAAHARGLRLLDCPSLPGRFSPKASGELVKEAVYHILEERRKLS